ncbi:nucleotidyltransferase family protein [Micromonospora sp. NBC_01412]|uniref:nucleotidyltransferase family protein n=1 Tax=Micromonospora sp. NBC_01412 TaxID=2903590 RepID=UPI0032514277
MVAWPDPPWEAKNQAAVHTWYPANFGGGPVATLRTIADAVVTWPEYATAVAVRLDAHDQMGVCAPHGLDDLLDGVWRRNPTRVSPEISRQRLARHRPAERWPRRPRRDLSQRSKHAEGCRRPRGR